MRSYFGLLLRNDVVRSPTRIKLRIEAENFPNFRRLTPTFLFLVLLTEYSEGGKIEKN